MIRGNFHTCAQLQCLLLATALFCSIGSNAQSPDTAHIVYLVYGLPPDLLTQCAQKIAASDMGFEFRSVGGCLVSDNVRKDVAKKDQEADSLLVLKIGSEWEKEFDRRTDVERATIGPIDSIARLTPEYSVVRDSIGIHGSLWVLISKDENGDYPVNISTFNDSDDGIETVRRVVFSREGIRR